MSMFSSRLRKSIAVFFLVLIVQSVIAPSLSYALTAGPTAPEFSSFEPVDTTDLVNLATGELVYNMPVLEVPGPEGGYPLSLSYHAGIKLDQEASWVGLGWTLNPGAINRTVNGYADDNVQTKRQVRDYWGGGTQVTKTYSLGLTIPRTGIGVNYSLARTRDTYKGFSSTYNLSVSASRGNANITLNMGGSSTSAGKMGHLTFKNVAGKVGGLPGGTSMGISINSKSVKTNINMMGIDPGAKNNVAGNISSFSKVTDIGTAPIGMFGSFTLKDFYTRYWSDASQSLFTYGSLYPALGNEKIQSDYYVNGELQSFAFDSYDLYDGNPVMETNQSANTVDDVTDPTKQLGGSLPAFDQYDVLGQGVGGIIQPHIFENGDMFGQNFYQRGPEGQPASAYPILGFKSLRKFTNSKVDFRFLNDFSNALTINTPQFEVDGTTLSLDEHEVNAKVKGFNDEDGKQKLAGSKHVEWFTNEEIANGTAQVAGFMDCYENSAERKLEFEVYENYLQPEAALPYHGALTYGRAYGSFKDDKYLGTDPYLDISSPQFHSLKPRKVDVKKKIGGFMITNETGVTYHYALPVYNYNEYTKSKLKRPRKGVSTFREYKNDDPYAYTWLLTAVTGPDYVDRNGNNILDDDDWGYWVKFDYGRWADAYQWRTPHTGYIDDIESEYQTFSYGIKELYYLDAVETRSHKAIFIKSKRKDGKGVTSRLEGGSNPRRFKMHYKFGIGLQSSGELEFNVSPVSTMKLDAIYLFKKSDLKAIPVTKASGSRYNEATTSQPHEFGYKKDPYTYTIPGNPSTTVTIKQGEDFVYVKYHNGDLVYDDDDIYNAPQFKEKALRIIEFKTDYSLAAGVPNSIGFLSDINNRYCQEFPSIKCDEDEKNLKIGDNYEWPEQFTKAGTGKCSDLLQDAPYCCLHNELFYSKNGVFERFAESGQGCPEIDDDYVGDNFVYVRTGKLTLTGLKFLGKGGADLLPLTAFEYQDNPLYRSYRYDVWGYHKSDYILDTDAQNNPILKTREITATSTEKTDAWSLSAITSPLGARTEIEYEPNQYRTSVYNDFSVLSIEKLEFGDGQDEVKITFKEKDLGLSKWFAVGNFVDIKAFVLQTVSSSYTFSDASYEGDASSDQITAVGSDFIKVNSAELRNRITSQSNPTTVPYFISGFIKVNDPSSLPKYAGGIRVHSLSIVDGHLGRSTTVFEYKDPVTETSSGVTSFKPFNQPSVQYPVDVAFFDHILEDSDKKTKRRALEAMQINFQKTINEPFTKFLTFSKEAPAPGVMYEWVKVTSSLNDQSENYMVHHFNVFKENMIEKEVTTTSEGDLDKRTVTIKNNTVDVGSILSIKSYSNQNVPLTSLDYRYLYDDNTEAFEIETIDSNQGVVEQSFHKSVMLREYKVDINRDNWWEDTFGGGEAPEVDIVYKRDKALITKRRDRSNVVTVIKETDHKRGLVTETQNHAFDFYSGQVLKTHTTDSYGNKYLTTVVPAYEHYADMGLKVYNVQNKNMLTQVAEQNSVLLANGSQSEGGLLSASVQTWSKGLPVLGVSEAPGNIWRMHASYQWNGQEPLNNDGTYKIAHFNTSPFNWSNPSLNSDWEKSSEVTLYNLYSHSLEAKDINGNFASTRMDQKQEKVIASAVNASYAEMAFSGAELYTDNTGTEGGVNRAQGIPASGNAHTGQFSLLVGSGSQGFNYTLTSPKADLAKKYRASVWVYAPGYAETQAELDKVELYYTVNGQEKKVHPVLKKSRSKNWYLLNIDIDPESATEVYVGVRNNATRGVYFDDFRVHPLNAQLTAYVYDATTDELTYILDANNFYTKFEYDAIGRLIRSSKELLNFDFGDGKESLRPDAILKETRYNYGTGH